MKTKLILTATLLASSAVSAESVRDVMTEGKAYLVAQRESQQRIDQYNTKTDDTEAEYQRLLRQIEGLEAYNRQLQKQIDAQEEEIARTDASISKATEVDRQLLPLLISMVDTYDKLVEVSVPFLPGERKQRIDFLRETVDRADVSAAEKFRQVLDAYMTELSYGNTIEAYTDTIQAEGGEREVNVLRVGRIALFYQTADRLHTGYWDADNGRWEKLGPEFRNGVYQAVRVANKLTAPNLLSLPLPPAQDLVSDSYGLAPATSELALNGVAQ